MTTPETIRAVLQHLRMCAQRQQELSHGIDLKGNAHHLAAEELDRVLPRAQALERLFEVARILETFGPYENCSELERELREAVKGVRATEGAAR